uniref:uncharacterized protein LOC101466611 isoform X2 n=1 Tax=Maylandia zebra TaxID=106582 RepID=UPI000D2FC6EE|nr:uncharacterized protein LOC101466611 isoform X2 [Maylandia zebra]
MDTLEPIWSTFSGIYTLAENVKANKKRCQRISVRVKALEDVVKSITEFSPEVKKAVEELILTLESTQRLIEKYTAANLVERILKSGSHGEEFDTVSERLNDAYQALCLALQSEQSKMLYEVFRQRETEDEMDGKEDDTEMTKLLMDYMKEQQEKTNTILRQLDKVVQMLNKPSFSSVAVRQIKPDELKYQHPKKPFKTTASCELYKGEYQGFSVAIKRYLDPMNTSARLHNTEEKWRVHGSINSSKFLVTKDYTVKLGGFRLSKTETSLKRQTEDRAVRSLCYHCPEKFHDASFSYCKEWEMYSFGIILWEIVTCKNPFEGFSDEKIYQKVYEEKYQEPLPDDCPAELGQLINKCRAYDCFQRPSAGVLLDKLRSVVTQLEEQQD